MADEKRICEACGGEIINRGNRAKFCLNCKDKRKRKQTYDSKKRRESYATKMNRIYSKTGDITQCKTCMYWNKDMKWCDFMSIVGRPRRCEASPNCTEYRSK